MSRRWKLILKIGAFAAAVAVVACSDAMDPSDKLPESASLSQPNGVDTSNGNGPDTATGPDTSNGPDTASGPDTVVNTNPGPGPDSTQGGTTFPGDTLFDALIAGSVIGIDSTVSPFVELSPIPGTRVTAFRWLGVDSSGTSVQEIRDSVAATTTGGDGTFSFKDLRSGIYILRAVPPEGSPWRSAEIGTHAISIRALVRQAPVKIYLHRK